MTEVTLPAGPHLVWFPATGAVEHRRDVEWSLNDEAVRRILEGFDFAHQELSRLLRRPITETTLPRLHRVEVTCPDAPVREAVVGGPSRRRLAGAASEPVYEVELPFPRSRPLTDELKEVACHELTHALLALELDGDRTNGFSWLSQAVLADWVVHAVELAVRGTENRPPPARRFTPRPSDRGEAAEWAQQAAPDQLGPELAKHLQTVPLERRLIEMEIAFGLAVRNRLHESPAPPAVLLDFARLDQKFTDRDLFLSLAYLTTNKEVDLRDLGMRFAAFTCADNLPRGRTAVRRGCPADWLLNFPYAQHPARLYVPTRTGDEHLPGSAAENWRDPPDWAAHLCELARLANGKYREHLREVLNPPGAPPPSAAVAWTRFLARAAPEADCDARTNEDHTVAAVACAGAEVFGIWSAAWQRLAGLLPKRLASWLPEVVLGWGEHVVPRDRPTLLVAGWVEGARAGAELATARALARRRWIVGAAFARQEERIAPPALHPSAQLSPVALVGGGARSSRDLRYRESAWSAGGSALQRNEQRKEPFTDPAGDDEHRSETAPVYSTSTKANPLLALVEAGIVNGRLEHPTAYLLSLVRPGFSEVSP